MTDDPKSPPPADDDAKPGTVTPVDTDAQDEAAEERKEDGGYQ